MSKVLWGVWLSTPFGQDILDFKPRGMVILLAAVVNITLLAYGRRLNRGISVRLRDEGDASKYPDPQDLAVWSPGWRAYETVVDASIRRQIRISRLFQWVRLLAALIAIVAMFAY